MLDLAHLTALLEADKIDSRAVIEALRGVDLEPDESSAIWDLVSRRFKTLDEPCDDVPSEERRRQNCARGYRLEELLVTVCMLERLEPAPSYRGRGEQIDGLFVLDGAFILLESKWHADPLPASDLYAFTGKVEGKLVGTTGLFVSMSGFSPDAAKALAAGKAIRVILMDGDDVRAVFDREVSWSALVDLKRRRAAQYGVPYFSWQQHKDQANA